MNTTHQSDIQSNNKMAVQIPIVIARMIDDGIGVPFFRAFSPFEFFAEGNHAFQQQELIEQTVSLIPKY